jgi:hypothetical protein
VRPAQHQPLDCDATASGAPANVVQQTIDFHYCTNKADSAAASTTQSTIKQVPHHNDPPSATAAPSTQLRTRILHGKLDQIPGAAKFVHAFAVQRGQQQLGCVHHFELFL